MENELSNVIHIIGGAIHAESYHPEHPEDNWHVHPTQLEQQGE